MYKYLLQISVFVILLFAIPTAAFAIDYTAKGGRKYEQSSNNDDPAKCSRDDLRIIKRFDYKAKEKLDEYKAIEETASTVLTRRAAEEFSKKMAENKEFFESGEFKEMKLIYKRCGMEIPEPKSEPPFWAPIDDKNDTLN